MAERLKKDGFADPVEKKDQTVILLRWILIIATAYLLLFQRPLSHVSPLVAGFVAFYLGSNIVASLWFRHFERIRFFEIAIVLFDALAVSMAILLVQDVSSDLFLLYFGVMFIGTLAERLELVVVAALLVAAVHFYTSVKLVGLAGFQASGQLLRIPFLFAVALFFGHLVQRARSAERRAREAIEKERMRSDFISQVTHDLKNPLSVIESLAGLLLEGECGAVTDDQAGFIQRIHANARRMTTLSVNLLDASRIEAGRLTLQKTPSDLADVVEQSISLARPAATVKKIDLHFDAADDLPKIEIDPIQMSRVVSNLLDNAIEHTSAGGSIRIRIERVRPHLRLSISDDGSGIPPDRLARIFERYHESTKGRPEGSGLGLFIVKAIVDAHGARLNVESTVGSGTTFTIDLPER